MDQFPHLCFTVEELAAALRMRPRTFYDRKAGLEARGFPRPVPGMGARWPVLAVTQWINQQLPAAASLAAPETGAGTLEGASSAPVIAFQKRLEARYGGRS